MEKDYEVIEKVFPKKTKAENELIMQKVPTDVRVRAVYVPLLVTECANKLIIEEVVDRLRDMRLQCTKKFCRETREFVRMYEKQLKFLVGTKDYNTNHSNAMELYYGMFTDLQIYKMGYAQALLKDEKCSSMDIELRQALAPCYLVKKLYEYVRIFDMETEKIVESYIFPKSCHIDPDPYPIQMMRYINHLLDIVGAPNVLTNYNLELSYKIFQNNIQKLNLAK